MTARRTAWRDRALTVGAVVGSLCILVAVLCTVVGVRPLIFRSGSMSPAIQAGALAFAKDVPSSDLEVGDVVSVMSASGDRITHRVATIGQASSSGERVLTLKGDANRDPDTEAYRVTRADRVLFDVPWAGYVLSFLRSGPGLFLLGVLACLLLLVVVRPGACAASGRRRGGARKRAGSRRAGRVAVPLVAGVAVVATALPALASFTDTAKVTSGDVKTGTIAVPSLTCGALGLLSVTFNWTAVSGATSYTLYYGSTSKTVTTTSTSITGVANATSTAYVVANRNFGSTTWTSAASNTRSYTFLVLSTCG